MIQLFKQDHRRFESQMILIVDICEADDSQNVCQEIMKVEKILNIMQDLAQRLAKVGTLSRVKGLIEFIMEKEGEVVECKRN